MTFAAFGTTPVVVSADLNDAKLFYRPGRVLFKIKRLKRDTINGGWDEDDRLTTTAAAVVVAPISIGGWLNHPMTV